MPQRGPFASANAKSVDVVEDAPPLGRKGSVVVLLLFLAASVLIGRASVEQNVSPFTLDQYVSGHAGMPYQARLMMVPVLRWAQQSRLVLRAAAAMHNSVRGPMELVLQVINSLCLAFAGWIAYRIQRRLLPSPIFPWLAPWLLLWVVAITFVVRYDQRLFLPYDFVSLVFFNLGLLACLEGQAILFLLVIAVGAYNRETTLFLIPFWFVLHRVRTPRSAIVGSVVALGLWALVKLHLQRLVHQPSPGLEFNWNWNLAAIALPHHWAQLLSIGGYLAIPLWMGRRLLRDETLRLLWFASIPFLLGTFIFGVWNETRIFGELSVLVAITAAAEFDQLMLRTVAGSRFGEQEALEVVEDEQRLARTA